MWNDFTFEFVMSKEKHCEWSKRKIEKLISNIVFTFIYIVYLILYIVGIHILEMGYLFFNWLFSVSFIFYLYILCRDRSLRYDSVWFHIIYFTLHELCRVCVCRNIVTQPLNKEDFHLFKNSFKTLKMYVCIFMLFFWLVLSDMKKTGKIFNIPDFILNHFLKRKKIVHPPSSLSSSSSSSCVCVCQLEQHFRLVHVRYFSFKALFYFSLPYIVSLMGILYGLYMSYTHSW